MAAPDHEKAYYPSIAHPAIGVPAHPPQQQYGSTLPAATAPPSESLATPGLYATPLPNVPIGVR